MFQGIARSADALPAETSNIYLCIAALAPLLVGRDVEEVLSAMGAFARTLTGEHGHNAVMFEQLLQAQAVDIVQIDACRVGGVNENVAILWCSIWRCSTSRRSAAAGTAA